MTMMIERLLLDQLVPPSVLINESGDVFHVHGRTGKFLEPAPGPQTRPNIHRMVRDNLDVDLGAALRRAVTEGREVVHENVRVQTNGQWIVCELRVRPLANPPGLKGMLLVSFERSRPLEESHEGDAARQPDRMDDLATELQRMRDHHQSTVEELETANEELQSINEQLQSTNEELETSKEEMQSLNEELQTVNAELEDKLELLHRSNDDMKNLLNATDIATVFLDEELRIKSYTERARKVINLIPTDLGRPIGDLVTKLHYDRLVADAQEVLRTLVFREVEVRGESGGWFLARILPYRTAENVIDGVVVSFIDTTKIKELQAMEERIHRVLDHSATVVFAQDEQLRYVWVSGRLFGLGRELVLDKKDADLLAAADAEKLAGMKRRVLEGHAPLRERISLSLASGSRTFDVYLETSPATATQGTLLVGSLSER